MNKNESLSVKIHGLTLDNVYFENLGPLEVNALVSAVEKQINKIAQEKQIVDTYKLLLHTALYFAAQAYVNSENSGFKKQDEKEQLDIVIDKLSSALNRLPLE